MYQTLDMIRDNFMLLYYCYIEDRMVQPLCSFFRTVCNRVQFGRAASQISVKEDDWSGLNLKSQKLNYLHYITPYGHKYTYIYADTSESPDEAIFNAEFVNGDTIVDITDEFRQIAGPLRDFHNQDLTMQDILQYLASVNTECKGPYGNSCILRWTSGTTLESTECSNWDQVVEMVS